MTGPGKLWNFRFVFILFSSFTNSVAFNMVMPLTPDFAVYMGASLRFAGIFTGVFALAALLARPFANVIGDRVNKKWMFVLALVGNGAVVLLYAATPYFMWLMPIRIFHGIFFSISITMSMVIIVNFIPKERLGEGIGYSGVAFLLGVAFGPNIGIFLAENFSFHANFLASGTITALVGLAIAFLPYRHFAGSTVKKKYRLSDFVAVELLPNVMFAALLTVGIGLVNSYIVMLGSERGIPNIGLYFVIGSAVLLFSRPYMGRLTDKKGVPFVIIPGFVLTAAGLILIGVSFSLWTVLLASSIIALGNGALPALQVDSLRKLSASRRTVATGTYLIGIDLGMGTGQTLGGVLTEALGFGMVFISMGILVFLGLGIYLLYIRLANRKWRACMENFKLAIFDLDGVIVDTAKYHYIAWKELADKLGIEFTHDHNERLKGVSRVRSLEILLEIGGMENKFSPEEKEKMAAEKNKRYVEYISKLRKDEILQGSRELLMELRKKGIKTGLGSASKNARQVLDSLEITDLFDVIIDGTNTSNAKPDPEVFILGAKALGVDPADCVVFEDAQAGIEAAINAGMTAIGVGSKDNLSGASLYVKDLEEYSNTVAFNPLH